MTKSQTFIYVHVTWTTKHRIEFMSDPLVIATIIKHIRENAVKKNIPIEIINGHKDHLHVLLRLVSTDNVARCLKLMKGESSWWIRRNLPGMEAFEWQIGYDARTISLDQVEIVRNYIANQDEHHKQKDHLE